MSPPGRVITEAKAAPGALMSLRPSITRAAPGHGRDACAEVSFRSIDRDDDCMTICVHCEPVDVNIHSLLVAGNSVSVMHGDDGLLSNSK